MWLLGENTLYLERLCQGYEKSIFGANVYPVPGLCLLVIGGAPYISQQLKAKQIENQN